MLTPAQMRAAVPQAMPCHERAAGTVNPLIVTELVKRPEVARVFFDTMQVDVTSVQIMLCKMGCHCSRQEISNARDPLRRDADLAATRRRMVLDDASSNVDVQLASQKAWLEVTSRMDATEKARAKEAAKRVAAEAAAGSLAQELRVTV